jgi:hypothetical protein
MDHIPQSLTFLIPMDSRHFARRAAALALCALFLFAVPASAQTIQSGDSFDQNVKLETPNLRVGIPGVQLTAPTIDTAAGVINVSFLGQYIAQVYRYAVAVASVVAVVMIIVAGFQWTASGGSPDAIGSAKKRIVGAVTGLILAVGSYTILYAVNPELVQFRNLSVQYVQPQNVGEDLPENSELPDDFWDTAQNLGAGVVKPSWNTPPYFDCGKKETYSAAGVMPLENTIIYTCPVGVFGKVRTIPDMKPALCKAGEILNKQGKGLIVKDSYRPFAEQVNLWCGRGTQEFSDPARRKRAFAVPGFSPHGNGVAIDVHLTNEKGERYYEGVTAKSQCGVDKAYIKTLADALYEATKDQPNQFYRLTTEIWHFEYIVGNSPRKSLNQSNEPLPCL